MTLYLIIHSGEYGQSVYAFDSEAKRAEATKRIKESADFIKGRDSIECYGIELNEMP